MSLPLVLIHGYSDRGASFAAWRTKLTAGSPAWSAANIFTCSYQSLTDEVTIKDLADALDRALSRRIGDQPFDAIVHSTGMLVIREWLAGKPRRIERLKHLVALAPATFGSPLARQGRSWLGAVFKGSKHIGPDFLASGEAILDALELASPYTWDLAARDILAAPPLYDDRSTSPYVFIFCGSDGYDGIRELVNTPGVDGTVRWAGCSFNTRKIVLDFTLGATVPVGLKQWTGSNIPVHLMPGMNHGTILVAPTDQLAALVKSALVVADAGSFGEWLKTANAVGLAQAVADDPKKGAWQQIVMRAVDQRGDPIRDFHVALFEQDDPVDEFDGQTVAVYSRDGSYRCFHVDVGTLLKKRKQLTVKIMALSGSTWVDYQGFGWERYASLLPSPTANERWDATLDLTSQLIRDQKAHDAIRSGAVGFDNQRLFAPFTTTLVELRLDRDALPLDLAEISKLLTWDP